ncbi:oleosin 1-like [Olea europaea var. sylvestris]|uniref:Oleosin n=1 Tax=Olea europaea subsp. europaea TaxID=158383 RepID=A0A8S0TR96_OLEEU|nr:oleosin 1-like [Olea europaea var. sylvestris]CAA3008546.1 oleosin 1-like [Olea europaea subsp. europaea]
MAEQYQQQHYGQQQKGQQQQQKQPVSHQVVKAATGATAGGSLLVLSGLTLAGTVIALSLATPLLVIFSPVLVPAAITIFMLGSGFLASGGFTVAGVGVLSWIYKMVTGKRPTAVDQLAAKAQEMKGKGEHYGQERTSGSQSS